MAIVACRYSQNLTVRAIKLCKNLNLYCQSAGISSEAGGGCRVSASISTLRRLSGYLCREIAR